VRFVLALRNCNEPFCTTEMMDSFVSSVLTSLALRCGDLTRAHGLHQLGCINCLLLVRSLAIPFLKALAAFPPPPPKAAFDPDDTYFKPQQNGDENSIPETRFAHLSSQVTSASRRSSARARACRGELRKLIARASFYPSVRLV
jgi:hypothetical protein